MTEPLKVAIAGLGTVGIGTVKILQELSDTLAKRSGRGIEITAVSARSKGRDRGADLSNYAWYDDAATIDVEADCDVVVELIGGSEGIAKDTVEAAVNAGRHGVTAT